MGTRAPSPNFQQHNRPCANSSRGRDVHGAVGRDASEAQQHSEFPLRPPPVRWVNRIWFGSQTSWGVLNFRRLRMNLYHASQQWAQRPADERYWNLREMFEAT